MELNWLNPVRAEMELKLPSFEVELHSTELDAEWPSAELKFLYKGPHILTYG